MPSAARPPGSPRCRRSPSTGRPRGGPVSRSAGYGVPMSVGLAPSAAPVWVRLAVLTGASELIGVAAHASNGGGLPQPGAWLVITMLVSGLVGGLLGVARLLRSTMSRGGPTAGVEDLAAVAALVLGQWVVHWQLMPVSPTLGLALPPAHHHAAVPVGAGMAAHHAGATSGTGVGMLLGHAAAAVLVALLLRWLESRGPGLRPRAGHPSTPGALGVVAVAAVRHHQVRDLDGVHRPAGASGCRCGAGPTVVRVPASGRAPGTPRGRLVLRSPAAAAEFVSVCWSFLPLSLNGHRPPRSRSHRTCGRAHRDPQPPF